MTFALVLSEESFDYEDDSLMGGNIVIRAMQYLFSFSFPVGLEKDVFLTVMRLEYLQSHIGEKRSASQALHLNNSSLSSRFSKTALLYRVVFFLFIAVIQNYLTKIFRSLLIHPVSSKVNL